jgi:hypothetical protein
MAPVTIDKATLEHLVNEALKLMEEDIKLADIQAMLAAHIGRDKKGEFVLLAPQANMKALRVVSKADRVELWNEIKEKLQDLICTKDMHDLLNGNQLSEALKVLIPAICTALSIVAPEAAVMGVIVWLAAYLIKQGIFKLCKWPRT